MSKKNKFDLTHLVRTNIVKEGETLFFVSDPEKTCQVVKMPNNEFKVKFGKEVITVHAFAQHCLGTEPPNHATVWVRTAQNKTLYDLWHAEEEFSQAA